MAIQEATQDGKLTREECWKMVNEAVNGALKEAFEKIFTHPFTQELKDGTLPMECIRGWLLNTYAWSLEINMSLPYRYHMLNQRPDLLELLADRYADEFVTPVRGGHQRTLDALGKALGLEKKELHEYRPLAAMRSMLDSNVWALEVNLQFGIGNTTEEWFGKWCWIWYQSLTKHYGISEEGAYYFRLHSEADNFGEHEGGETIGHEVMGHAEGNRYITVRMLEDGFVKPEGLKELVLRSSSVERYLSFLDAVYYTYHPAKKLSELEQFYR
jgi:pyrroloquinoline quinone (PQQ) biosynthesis protein C